MTAHGEGGKLASEILSLTLTGKVDIGTATVSVKNLETSSEKQQGQLEYPESLKAPIPLGPRNQLKVHIWTIALLLGMGAGGPAPIGRQPHK